jgi:tetratricopeptide (TPR) repeat protein
MTEDESVSRRAGLVHREVLQLIVLALVAVIVFFFTRAFAAGNDRIKRSDAAAWYDVGRRALADGRPDAALSALRRAATRDPAHRGYQLALASALASSHQDDAARDVLVGLREAAPEDAEINTQLARLDARRGDLDDARRYYQSALNALWRPDQGDARRTLRVELIRLLLAHDEKSRALAELILLTANLPDQAQWQVDAGRMFLEAGDPKRALDRFARAVALEPANAAALEGAGQSAFAVADYPHARRYLGAAPADAPGIADLRALTDLVLADDPLAARLSVEERTRRLLVNVQQARQRVAACLATLPPGSAQRGGLETAAHDADVFAPSMDIRSVRESRDAIETGVELAGRMEQQSAQACGPATPRDRSLLLIARLHASEER